MAGRKTKLTPETQQEIINVLTIGGTIKDACARASVDVSTFYKWLERGNDANGGIYLEFVEAVTRAQTAARISAVDAIRNAIAGHPAEEVTVETFRETRLRKKPDGSEEPYTYERTTTRRTTSQIAPDWRAAIEYLKRRDAEHWQPVTKIEVSWQDQAVADIRAGVVTYEALAGAFDDDLATQLFTRAGVPVPPR